MKASLVSATSLGALLAFELMPAHAGTVFTLNSTSIGFGDTLVNCANLAGCVVNKVTDTATLNLTASSGFPGTIIFGTPAAPVTGGLTKTYAAQTLGTTVSTIYTFQPTVKGQTTSQTVNVIATMASGKTYNTQSTTVTFTGTGVAPVESVSATNNGYVLVKSSNTATVTINNTGNGNTASFFNGTTLTAVPHSISNLNGSVSAANGTGFSGTTASSVSLTDTTTTNYTYTYAPTVKGAAASVVVTTTFSDGNSNGQNTTQTVLTTLTGTGVAPVQSVGVTNLAGSGGTANSGNLGYFLVNSQTGTATVKLTDTGNGNLAGSGGAFNLNGSVTALNGTSFSGNTTPQSVSLNDSNYAGTGATLSSAYTYTFAPTVRGGATTIVTSSFSNGSSDGLNNTQTVITTLTGTGVAPIQSTSNTGLTNPYVLVNSSQTSTATVTLNNTGNGNLAGTGGAFNLNGSVSIAGNGFSNTGANSVSLNDSNYAGTGATTSAAATFVFKPTVTGAATATATVVYSDGNTAGNNAGQTLNYTYTGTGVAPVATLSGSGPGYVLVGNTKSVLVTVQNTGNGNLSGAGTISNLQGSVFGGGGLFSSTSLTLGSGSGIGDTSSTTISYVFTPTGIGTGSTNITGTFTNGIGNTNSAGSQSVTLSGSGVAPVETVANSNAGYVLVNSAGNTGTATVTVTNTGNGNLAGTDSPTLQTNLHGSVGLSSSVFTGGGGSVNLQDSTSSGATISTTFTYNFAPTASGGTSTVVTTSFVNGVGAGGQNQAGSVTSTITGTGVAPIQTVTATGLGTNGYVLVKQTATTTVTLQNVGNGNLAGTGGVFNLNGSITNAASGFTGGPASPASVSLSDSHNTTTGATTQSYNYTFAPTILGATGNATLTSSFSNGSNNGAGQGYNNSQTVTTTLAGTGVAPVNSVAVANAPGVGGSANSGNLGYLLVGNGSATATVTQSDVGNGNLAGTGGGYNLNGSITNVTGTGYSGGTSGSSISLLDSNASGGATTSSYTYTFAPGVRGAATTVVTSAFSNGSADGQDNAATVNTTLTGTGVAPIASVSAGNNGYVLVKGSNTATVTVQDTGNGNLAGTGGLFNLSGSVTASAGTGFSGSTASSVSLQDANAGTGATTASYNYTFAPTTRGTATTIVTGNFSNGYGANNTSGSTAVTLTATGVAPINSVAVTNLPGVGGSSNTGNLGYLLVGSQTATASVTQSDVGDGNLAGTGGLYNLNGSISSANGSFTGSSGSTISLLDSNASGGATTSTYNYTFAPSVRGSATAVVTSAFSNGSTDGTNNAATVYSTLTGTGVAPLATISANNNGYVLVKQTNTATVTVQNTGNGNLAGTGGGFNLNGSVTAVNGAGFSGTTASATFSLLDSNASAGPTTQSYNYTFAPTVIGTASTVVTGNFSNGTGASNTSGTQNVTLTATGVAPINSVAVTNLAGVGGSTNSGNLGYLLVGSQTATATVTQSDIGNGNLAGTGGGYNLNGSITNATGSFTGGTAGSSISLLDSNAGTGATTSAYTYTFAPSVRGAATAVVTSAFSNGSADGQNNAATVYSTLTGTGVAPLATISATNNGYVLVKQSNEAVVTVQDIGNGNLAGTGGGFNLNGSVTAVNGTGYNGTTSSATFSLLDGNASGGATISSYNYTFAPTVRGASSSIVTGNYSNGIGSSNTSGVQSVTITGTGVAPIASVAVTNSAGAGGTANTGNLGYLLVGASTATATVTQSNIGDGNLIGTGYPYNLRGSVSNAEGNGFSGGTSGQRVYLQDSNASTGATTSSFTYTYAPTVVGSATTIVTSSFGNGSADGQNNANIAYSTLTGTGVAPIQSVTGGSTGYVLVNAQTKTTNVTVYNNGNGNLSGLGTISNLNGSVSSLTPPQFGGSGGTLSLGDTSTTTFTYSFAPTVTGAASATVTGNFQNGSANGQNQADSATVTITGTGVAPIQSMSGGSTGYALVNVQTKTTTVTVYNTGNGNLSGAGTISNLNGSVSSLTPPQFAGSGGGVSLGDTSTTTFTYSFAPTVIGAASASVTGSFANGSTDGQNLAASSTATITGTGVAPIQTVSATGAVSRTNNYQGLYPTYSGTSTAAVTVQNTGNGNLSGLGSISNLNAGSISLSGGTHFTGAAGNSTSLSLGDTTTSTLSYVYTPVSRGTQTATVTIGFTNGNSAGTNLSQTVAAQITGTGVGPVYQSAISTTHTGGTINTPSINNGTIHAEGISFGTLALAASETLYLNISNITDDVASAALTDMTLVAVSSPYGGDDPSAFSIGSYGSLVHEGGQTYIPITVTMNESGTLTSYLSITTDENAPLGLAGDEFTYALSASTSVPEPMSLVMFGSGLAGLGVARWRRRQKPGAAGK